MKIKIGKKHVGDGEPTLIMPDLASNHDGDIERAKKLIDLAVLAGADAVKFQSFLADDIISEKEFRTKSSFQTNWDKPVYQVYKEAELPRAWHKELKDYSDKQGIMFASSPYDYAAVDLLEELQVDFYKIGSGELNHSKFLKYVAEKGKPIMLGTGASTMKEIEHAVSVIRNAGCDDLILLQCVTNYPSPFEQAHIKAMVEIRKKFNVLVGYSDHTPGDIVPLGSVALGACVIEKHFTDDKTRNGPDHPFALDFEDLKKMVDDIRALEKALGKDEKIVYPCEAETVVLQRRSLYATRDIKIGEKITERDIIALRPARGLKPDDIDRIIGKVAIKNINKGDLLQWEMVRG